MTNSILNQTRILQPLLNQKIVIRPHFRPDQVSFQLHLFRILIFQLGIEFFKSKSLAPWLYGFMIS